MSDRQPKRYFDRARNQYFTWDRGADRLVYEDRSSRPRAMYENLEDFAIAPSNASPYGQPVYGAYTAAPASRGRAASSASQPASSIQQVGSQLDNLAIDQARLRESRDLQRVGGSNYAPYRGQRQDTAFAGTRSAAQPGPSSLGNSGEASRDEGPSASSATQVEAEDNARRQTFTPRQYATREGLRVSETYNPRNDVRMIFASHLHNPIDRITDPSLLRSGVSAQGMLIGNPASGEGDAERLYSSFQVRSHRFFVVGRVFLILWVEPAGTTAVTSLERNDFIPGRFQDEFIYSKVRRFVVVRRAETYCSAIPIMTYGGQGTGKRGVKKSEHVIIHTGSQAPLPLASESPARGDSSMRPFPIRVIADNPTDKLDDESRLDLGKVSTIQHNVKVKPFGNVHPSSMDALISQFQNVWSDGAQSATPSSVGPSAGAPESSKRSRGVSLSQGIVQAREEQPASNVPIQPVGRSSTQTAGTTSTQTRRQPGPDASSRRVASRAVATASGAASESRAGSGSQNVPGSSRGRSEDNEESSSESSGEEEDSARAPDAEAVSARNAYRRLRDHGASRNDAIERLIRTLMANTPGLSRGEAESRIRNYIASQ